MKSPSVPAPIPAPNAPTQASYLTRGTTSDAGRVGPISPITPVTGQSSIKVGRPSLLGQTA